jgi:hypothetical protein
MKKFMFLTSLLASAFWMHSQVAISYYPFQTSQLAVSTNTEKRFWADYRLETNTFFSNLNMELSPMWNFKRTTLVNYYLGPGILFNPVLAAADLPVISGYFLDLGARFKPFEKYRNLQLIFEISPYTNREFFGGNLRTRLGVAYNFGKKEQK